ncbi:MULTISPECIES: type 1 fimbrial protein [Klebsiella]|uniref:type 1 fimbrial protein n=1 Tax=Klebsiella TaxID=570 RepID=UPI00062C691E|nr:type 1 fimbrial protein [Klebsiella michiganensis]ELN3893305.1 type 1 fimbrial protein [Klebsiella michiganensis]ELS5411921.1 type 1 fimbrial protein [Klebsiella michiganensis]KKY76167.1 fimbrial protein [Klebsiella michiganensis]MBZ7105984.1 type 1 fimbrial protein [Klebsiella michiganensis]MCW9619072.1 type 1 fimbrial protein [Klebsiella michiganensis]
MKKYFLLVLFLISPGYVWACLYGLNYGDVSISNLPAKILLSAGSYTSGTVIYDSGKIYHQKTNVLNCAGDLHARFTWSSGIATTLIGNNIYATSVPGIGIRVKVWLNTTGEYDGESTSFKVDNSEHHIGDADFPLGIPGFVAFNTSTNYSPVYQLQLVATGGNIDTNRSLSFTDPVSTVAIKDSNGELVISQLHISGTTNIQLVPMGCTASTAALNFQMGSVKTSEFSFSNKVGSVQQTFTLTCEPGTNVAIRVTAAEAEGDNPDHSVIALTPGENVATGVGVQLSIDGIPLAVNNATYQVFADSKRTTITNPEAEASYSIFTEPDNPGGAAATNSLTFTANYYKYGSEVTPGEANASGTLTFIYN